MNYRTGELDQRITIERKTLTPDGMGGHTTAWATLYQVWAHVRNKSGGESVEFDRINAYADCIFIVRNGISISEGDRILYAGRYFNVKYIQPIKSRALYLELEAKSGVAT